MELVLTLWLLQVAGAVDVVPRDETPPLELNPEPVAQRAARVAGLGTAQLAFQYGMVRLSHPENWQVHGNSLDPSWSKFRSNFERAPVREPRDYGGGGALGLLQADGDLWPTNVLSHGLQGSEIYLRMRRNGFPWWSAGLVSAAHSAAWEYGIEGWHETPSAWDLGYTPVGGMLFGELRYRMLRAGKDHWYVRALADPIGELLEP